MNQIAENCIEINNGDTVSILTYDGKYKFDYKVVMVWYGDFQVELDDGHRVSLERVVGINGKKFDFKNSWKLKKVFINH